MRLIKTTRSGGSAVMLVALFLVVLGLAGCGSSSSSTTQDSPSAGGSGDGATFMSEAEAELARLYKGTYQLPKARAPQPAKDRTIWVVSIGQTQVSGVEAINAFRKAAANFGWDVTVIDGKFEPNLWLNGIRDAVAANADGIWLFNIDCAPVKAGIEEAETAGIPVIINAGRECAPGTSDPASYITRYMTKYDDGVVSKGDGSIIDLAKAIGAAGSWWIAVQSDGDAKLIQFEQNDAAPGVAIAEGSEAVMERCPDCEVVEQVKFIGTELGPSLQQKAQQALIQHPEADAVHADYDLTITSGVGGGISASGRDPLLVTAEGTPPIIDLARQGLVSAGNGYQSDWEGWCGVDAFIYLYGDQAPRACGLGVQLWDPERNFPPAGQGFNTGLPFEDAYLRSWGVK